MSDHESNESTPEEEPVAEQEEPVVEAATEADDEANAEDEAPILTPEQLRSQHPRQHLGRKFEYVEGIGSKVWIWGLSWDDRQLINQVSQDAEGSDSDKERVWYACYVGAVVRDSDALNSLQIWTPEVSVEHRTHILALGNQTVDHIIKTSQQLDGEKPAGSAAGIEKVLDFIGEVAVKMSSCIKHLCAACDGSDACPRKSSPECLHENSSGS